MVLNSSFKPQKTKRMHYKYRWYYATALYCTSMVIGYIYVIEPDLKKLSQLHQVSKNLQSPSQPIKVREQYSDRKHRPSSNLAAIAQLSNLVRLNHLSVKTASTTKNLIHLSLQGKYKEIIDFLLQLSEKMKIHMSNFKYQRIASNHYHLQIDLLLNKDSSVISKSLIKKLPNPFCGAANNENVMAVALQQMKMVGYLKQNNHIKAFILLPNGRMHLLQQGNRLGREQAKIIAISNQSISTLLPEGKPFIIKPNE